MFGRLVLACMTVPIATACTAPVSEADFDAPYPTARLYAIERAGAQRDETATLKLVEQLDSDDPAVQMLALEALLRIEGEAHGYWFGDPPHVRGAATQAWVDYVTARDASAVPAPGPITDDDG